MKRVFLYRVAGGDERLRPCAPDGIAAERDRGPEVEPTGFVNRVRADPLAAKVRQMGSSQVGADERNQIFAAPADVSGPPRTETR